MANKDEKLFGSTMYSYSANIVEVHADPKSFLSECHVISQDIRDHLVDPVTQVAFTKMQGKLVTPVFMRSNGTTCSAADSLVDRVIFVTSILMSMYNSVYVIDAASHHTDLNIRVREMNTAQAVYEYKFFADTLQEMRSYIMKEADNK